MGEDEKPRMRKKGGKWREKGVEKGAVSFTPF